MPVTAQELLHAFGQGELDIEESAVAQHHDEEGEPPAGRANANRAELAPVELGAFAGGKGELEEGFPAWRADTAHIVLDDRAAAIEAFLAQALEDLLRAVRMTLQEANDAGLEWVEPAAPRHRMSSAVLRAVYPLGHGLRMQAEGPRGLRDGQLLSLVAILDLAIGRVIDHGDRPKAARNWPILTLISSARGRFP